MDTCFRCERSEKEVRLVDAIYENEMVKVCERCAVTENIPVIRRPSTSQLRDSEKAFSVYQRMKKLAGLEKKEEKHATILDQMKKIEEQPELEMPEEKKPFNLVDNFHWRVARVRRNKGLSQRQLGWALGESEAAIKIIEKGELPEDAEKLIKKLEQFFQIKLREITEEELEEERRKAKKARERFISRIEKEQEKKEPEIEIEKEEGEIEKEKKDEIDEIEIEEIIEEKGREAASLGSEDELELVSSIASGKIAGSYIEIPESSPSRILSFKPDVVKNLTISDLKRIKEEREKTEKLAKAEEERKKSLQAMGLKEKIASEMKDVALGKTNIAEKTERKVEKTDKKELNRTPTIYELMEKKKEKERAQQRENQEEITGEEIELEE